MKGVLEGVDLKFFYNCYCAIYVTIYQVYKSIENQTQWVTVYVYNESEWWDRLGLIQAGVELIKVFLHCYEMKFVMDDHA